VPNPLLSDRDVEFLLYEVAHAEALCALPRFADHSRETFDLFLGSARKLAREVLWPAYKPMDEAPPRLEQGQVRVHPAMREIWPRLAELGITCATRPSEVGGQQLPHTVGVLASGYLMAANAAAFGFAGLTAGAAHLIEAFGDEFLKREIMPKMYSGEWSGTMALTEPQAGSSLSDVRTRARPAGEEPALPATGGGRGPQHVTTHYLLDGNKVFISGGDQDVTANIVHLVLARIEGAPAGIKGVSLFCVPKKRLDGSDNDCTSAGVFHKLGWKGLPSIALNFGERGDCHGWLVGKPNQGISYMFQMMNEARLMVGMNAIATASAAYHEAVEYARTRPQGRALSQRDPASPQLPIIEHADVRRMLLRQKAIVEGGLSLLVATARYSDLGDARSLLLLDLLTPVAKSFPAELGFESNALAVQIHGGYGYTSEYLPEAWLRDQKLNSIHEGTTGIHGMDLLGRKVVQQNGAALVAFAEEVAADVAAAASAEGAALQQAVERLGALTLALAATGDRDKFMLHSADYLTLFSIIVIAWQWLRMTNAAAGKQGDFYDGKRQAARYWFATELPRIEHLAALCESGEASYAGMKPAWF
jgi:alkylation response protein AidB-like acyl-CoA dehydrogenase